MLIILLSWIYMFALSFIVGVSIKRLLKLKGLDSVIIVFLGLFDIGLFTGFYALFFAINEVFQMVLLLSCSILLAINRKHIKQELIVLKESFKLLSLFFKCSLGILLLLLLAQCASPPFIIDNESYYIQTIKWLNNYGLTKGLVNLHLFLGQTSGWHILQSAFSFSFIYQFLNDLSGFCLLLGNYYAITKLNDYVSSGKKKHYKLIIGLFPLFNVFFFQFIGAPSPDIAIYVLGLIIFYNFIKCYSKYNRTAFYSIALLSIFATFIKLTGVFFFILAIIFFIKHYAKSKKTIAYISIVGCITLILFVTKNIIVTGNPIFPLAGIESLNSSWSLPKSIENYIASYSKASAYGLSIEDYEAATTLQLLKNWIQLPKLDGLLNKSMLLLFVVYPFVFKGLKKKKAYVFIYGLAVVNLLFLLLTSPQYRFFFPFLMFLSLCVASIFLKKKIMLQSAFAGSIVLAAIPLFASFNTSELTNTQFHTAPSAFSVNYIIEPHRNTKYGTAFETITIQNLKVNSPTEINFFWGTGDIPLPALNNQQLDYFSTYFNIIPQLRGETLKEGFYSKNLLND